MTNNNSNYNIASRQYIVGHQAILLDDFQSKTNTESTYVRTKSAGAGGFRRKTSRS